ncbi:hypothetical protein FE257_003952 [Aspergillus nanangensis]|uniref:Uncharacterized protein n=1 Tax=Aspergillus nanangensis TaxID=2582783 RepID=A0AAD4CRQ2_ASPNN|nr:hypothetical protein FE257_003952 [Aspergillus nanangensis]
MAFSKAAAQLKTSTLKAFNSATQTSHERTQSLWDSLQDRIAFPFHLQEQDVGSRDSQSPSIPSDLNEADQLVPEYHGTLLNGMSTLVDMDHYRNRSMDKPGPLVVVNPDLDPDSDWEDWEYAYSWIGTEDTPHPPPPPPRVQSLSTIRMGRILMGTYCLSVEDEQTLDLLICAGLEAQNARPHYQVVPRKERNMKAFFPCLFRKP